MAKSETRLSSLLGDHVELKVLREALRDHRHPKSVKELLLSKVRTLEARLGIPYQPYNQRPAEAAAPVRPPLWEPITLEQQEVIQEALLHDAYLHADPKRAAHAEYILRGLQQPGRRLGVTCDPI